MKKTSRKSAPKERLKKTSEQPTAVKTRKNRDDPAQKRPVFVEFTNSWGFRGRKWWETESRWASLKHTHGKFLHPLLASIVEQLQRDYQSSVLRFLGPPYPVREADVSNKAIWRLHQIHQKKRNRERLNEDDQRDLPVWLKMLTGSLERIEQLGVIVAAAVACGDIALLEHLILIMQSLSKPTSIAARPKTVVVERAYDEIILRRKRKLYLKSNPGIKGLALLLGVAREDQNLLKQIRLPSASDVDKEIIKNSALKALAPEWSNALFDSNRRKIQRVCKQAGRELSENR